MDFFPFTNSLQIFCLVFLSILFIQSGLDKVLNYKGNLEWLKEHFAKSPLSGTVGLLMPAITILELAAGLLCLLGLIMLLLNGSTQIAVIGVQLSALSIIALFFGQRVAQDYEGAGNLVPYFLLCIVSLYLLMY